MGVQIQRWTGASGSETKDDITSINTRGQASDVHSTAGTDNPVLIPNSGTNYSYWISTRLYYDGSDSGTIDNIKWYSDGSNSLGTGITCVGQDADSYVQATGTEGETGDELTTGNHSGLSGAPEDVFNFTSGSPKSIAGSVTDPANEEISDFFVYQFAVADDASAGASSSETFTWQYDTTIAE